MLVRKVRNQNKVGKIIIFPAEVTLAQKLGIDLEDYIREVLKFIAKERRWKWYFNKGNT